MRTGLDDDLPELFLREQPAFGIDLQFEIHRVTNWLLADRPRGDLHILLANRIHDVARREVLRRNFVRIEPHAHRVIARPEDFYVTRARNSREDVLRSEEH